MKHYHGTPLGGTRESVARFINSGNRFFLIPFPRPEDLGIVLDSSCGFILDNGAFSAWKSGNPVLNWQPYYDWCLSLALHPRFDFAIIPDVIDGTEKENDRLVQQWFSKCRLPHDGWVDGAPVWHLHESLERLERLMKFHRVVCLGSSGQFANPGSEGWQRRMAEAMEVLCDEQGRPKRKIHGLRMLAGDIVERYPFYSCDSTNVAQNSGLTARFGGYCPPTQCQRREVIASRIEKTKSPSVWISPKQHQQLLSFEDSSQ